MRVCRVAPIFLHLFFFAEDSVIFAKASKEYNNKILNNLELHGKALGQCINFDNINIFFSPDIHRGLKEGIARSWQTKNNVGLETYLDLPIMARRAKNWSFRSIKDRVWKRITGWKEK